MKLAALFCALFLLVGPLTAVAASPTSPAAATQVNEIFILVDVSGSIVGNCPAGGCRDILADVKRSVGLLIDGLTPGSRLAILPFAGQSEVYPTYPAALFDASNRTPWVEVNQPSDAILAKQYVNNLVANGQSTHIVPALTRALDVMRKWQQLETSVQHAPRLYLYTDGIDNEPGRADWLADASKLLVTLRKQDLPFLLAGWLQIPGGPTVVCPREGFDLGCQAAQVATVRTSTTSLDFGQLTADKPRSADKSLALALQDKGSVPGSPGAVSLSLVTDGSVGFDATLEPGAKAFAENFAVAIRANPGQPAGVKTAFLQVLIENAIWTGPVRIPVRYEYKVESVVLPSIALKTTELDFGTMSHGALRSAELPLEFSQVSPAVVPTGASAPPAPKLSFAFVTEAGTPDAEVEPGSAPFAGSVPVALRAQAGQAPGVKTGFLTVRAENATYTGPARIPVRYTFAPPPCVSDCPNPAGILTLLAILAIAWIVGVIENRASKQYSIAR